MQYVSDDHSDEHYSERTIVGSEPDYVPEEPCCRSLLHNVTVIQAGKQIMMIPSLHICIILTIQVGKQKIMILSLIRNYITSF
jgi:hypothetical protein